MSSSKTSAKPSLGSSVFDWTRLPVIPTAVGERRDFFDATTKTLRNLECHATTLNPGETPHPPHRHPDEEMIIVKDGTVEVLINDRVQQAGAGSIFFFGSNDLHGLRNVGAGRATYHVIRILTAETPTT